VRHQKLVYVPQGASRCACPLTRCQTTVIKPGELCSLCSAICLPDHNRRIRRRKRISALLMLATVLVVAAMVVALTVGW
jgi:hypothetical protein